MSKKKIAIVTNSMKGGGTERFISYLLKHLEDKYEVHLLLTESKFEYEIPENQIIAYLNKDHDKIRNFTSIWEFPKFLVRIPLYAKRLVKYCKENEIDLIVSFLERSNFTACFAKILGFKGKVFISERTHTISSYGASLRGKIGLNVVKTLYPFADGIITNSIGSEIGLRDTCKIKNNYYVLSNILDIEEVRTKSLEIFESSMLSSFIFVYLAGFREGKNHQMLIEAFADLNNQNAKLLLLGKGKTMDEAIALTEKLGIKDSVIFEGYTDNPYKYLIKCTCFVSSSDFEGFPNVLLEAMACKLPIISTDCKAGPRELLAYKDNYDNMLVDEIEVCEHGILVPVGDKKMMTLAMKKMIDDENLRSSFVANSQKRINDFSAESVVKDFCEIIEN
jgi:N-acetylgalactosamine-N,N'-diacetylbacillosaminyl-diphospho-undecaprenol 4-alpha-N-acetylgalactosaminyltransferase